MSKQKDWYPEVLKLRGRITELEAQLDKVREECRMRLNPDTRYQDRESIGWENGKEDMAEDILAILEKDDV